MRLRAGVFLAGLLGVFVLAGCFFVGATVYLERSAKAARVLRSMVAVSSRLPQAVTPGRKGYFLLAFFVGLYAGIA